jgi:hypothetical protein
LFYKIKGVIYRLNTFLSFLGKDKRGGGRGQGEGKRGERGSGRRARS